MLLAPGLPGALYLKHQKIQNLKFQKIQKKYLDVANCIHYNYGNFQYEIPCYVGSG
jgi:hypothetical protein